MKNRSRGNSVFKIASRRISLIKALGTFIFCVFWASGVTGAEEIMQKQNDIRLIREAGGIQEYELVSNGLKILLMEDHTMPVVTVSISYLVGSRLEAEKTRGGTHLLEHMMFKDSEHFRKDQGADIPRRLKLAGGIFNATTWMDGTYYYESLPKDQLELALNIESDRMRGSLLRGEDLKSEMPVVLSEFDRLESSPLAMADFELWAKAFQTHPYHFPVIGLRTDIEKMPIENLKAFYDTYYWPNNAYLCIIGDYDPAKIFDQVRSAFGKILRSPHDISKIVPQEPEQKDKRFLKFERNDQIEAVLIAHKIPAATDPDTPALDLLAAMLSFGKNSMLYRALIDRGLAAETKSECSKTRDPGLFETIITLTTGTKHSEVEKTVLDIYETFRATERSEAELERAKNQLRAHVAYARDGSFSVANELSAAIMAGDWTLFAQYPSLINKVTAADIQRVARKYLVSEKMTAAYLVSKNASNKKKPAAGGPSPESTQPPSKAAATAQKIENVFSAEAPRAVAPLKSEAPNPIRPGRISDRIRIKSMHNIRCMSIQTGVQDVVSIVGSFIGGGTVYSENPKTALLTAALLDKGTRRLDKFAIAELFENHGVEISFEVDYDRVGFSARCLKKDVPLVISLIAEELRMPAFDAEEFNKQKEQYAVNLREAMSDTSAQGYNALSRTVYPPKHPRYEKPFELQLQDLNQVTLEEVKNFHATHYGPQEMILVAAGDLDPENFEKAVEESFKGWETKKTSAAFSKKTALAAKPLRQTINIPDKVKLDVLWGEALPITRHSKDYLPLHLANAILGGDYASKLSEKIRHEQGLTYSIYSSMDGIDHHLEGLWIINVDLNANVLTSGIEAVEKEIEDFRKNGVIAKELGDQKNTIAGRYQVRLATTSNLARRIHRNEELKLGTKYIDRYPGLIQAVTLKQVNRAIRRYFHPEAFNIVIAGTTDEKSS